MMLEFFVGDKVSLDRDFVDVYGIIRGVFKRDDGYHFAYKIQIYHNDVSGVLDTLIYSIDELDTRGAFLLKRRKSIEYVDDEVL